MKIALLEPLGIQPELLTELARPLLEAGHTFVNYDTRTNDPQEMIRRAEGCEAVMIANNPLPGQVIHSLPELKYINVAFTGIDHVDVEACRECGVSISNAAGYSDQSVAEMVIGMTICLLRSFGAGDTAVRSSRTSAGLMGGEIAGKTVGIIGTGHIGMMTAKLFTAFGAHVIAYSRTERPEALNIGIRYVDLDTLMHDSDIISIHVPNNAATRGLIGTHEISLMKPTALLVNCARGPIVNSAALSEALNADRIAGAAIDVYNMEPPIPADEPLLSAKHTLLTPHVAFLTREAMIRRAHIVFDNMIAYASGKPQHFCQL